MAHSDNYIFVSGDNYSPYHDVKIRAKNIQDNFGVKPVDLKDFRRQNGGTGFLRGMAIGGVITAIGAALAILPAVGVTALTIGAIMGTGALVLSMVTQTSRIVRGYDAYLDKVAAVGREARDRGIPVEKIMDVTDNNPAKSYADEIKASREQIAAAGAKR